MGLRGRQKPAAGDQASQLGRGSLVTGDAALSVNGHGGGGVELSALSLLQEHAVTDEMVARKQGWPTPPPRPLLCASPACEEWLAREKKIQEHAGMGPQARVGRHLTRRRPPGKEMNFTA